jgi:penicillin-binding protein 1A
LINFILRILFTITIGVGFGSTLAIYIHYAEQIPELNKALNYEPPLITYVYDREGSLLAEFSRERRIILPISQIPEIMQNAIIAIEDEHYYRHHGIDFPGIARAAWKNFLAGNIVQGGSTITQQLAKSLFLTRERTLPRKIKEALCAVQLEKVLTKSRIMELYLNQVYFGSGAYGIECASRTYFNKSTSELSLSEAAMLAGLPKAPSKYSPLRNPDLAESRRNLVLQRMKVNHFISESEAEAALSEPIILNPARRKPNEAPYFVEVLRRKLEAEFGSEYLYSAGLHIHTTLNLAFQKHAKQELVKGLDFVDRKRGWRGPNLQYELVSQPPEEGILAGAEILDVQADYLTLQCGGLSSTLFFKDIWVKNRDLRQLKPGDRIGCIVDEYDRTATELSIKKCHLAQQPEVEGALLSLDTHTGEILAWVGGYNFSRSQFDRVSQSRRQPGSAFKPFIYAAALDGEFTASDVIYDSPIVIEKTWELEEDDELDDGDSDGEDEEEDEKEYWKPHNYSEEFFGATTLRVGLAKSRNIVSIHLLRDVGVSNVIRIANQAGILSPLSPTLSLALGSSEVTLLELTQAYGTFATLGKSAEAMMIRQILDRHGSVIKEYYPSIRRAMREDTAFLTTNLLTGVIQHGTGFSARELGRPMGGKTGTTNHYHDAWFIGFTPQVVTGTWVGMDILEPIYKRATGASAALPIWKGYMGSIINEYEAADFDIPEGIVFEDVCMDTGQLATPRCEKIIHEAFREGREPIVNCEKHQLRNRRANVGVSVEWDSIDGSEATEPAIVPSQSEDENG